MTVLVIDGVFFQLASSGIARVWDTILTIWAKQGRFDTIYFLDRGNAPIIEGVTNIPFPRYHAKEAAADSALIQKMCDHLGADVFTSTYYTTPLTTPMALMVYDMIPELFDFDMTIKEWAEKSVTISFAQRYLCISHSTQKDLLNLYPDIPADRSVVSHCGVDKSVFKKNSKKDVDAFRKAHGLKRDYFLFVGSRVQHKAYKNSELFFNALTEMQNVEFDVFCVGGEPQIEQQVWEKLPAGVTCQRVSISDEELSIAYTGATALVYPSLYEGFGMPVIEAMAANCPVITTQHGSLAEAAGDAGHLISGHSVIEMAEALSKVQSAKVQADLRKRGLSHVKKFEWANIAEDMAKQIEAAQEDGNSKKIQDFVAEWARLREIQANVDHQ